MTTEISYGTEFNANAKTELVAFCQRKTQKSMAQGDIVYEVDFLGEGQYQATVTLNCLGGEQFCGEVSADEKAAHHAAAHQALLKHAVELAEQQGQKRKREALMDASQKHKGQAVDRLDKYKLHHVLEQLLGRELEVTTDMVFAMVDTDDGGFQATLTLPTLMGMETECWLSEVMYNKQDARLDAASKCLQAILNSPLGLNVDMTKIPEPAQRSFKGKGFGKDGKGKGKGMMGKMMGMMNTCKGGKSMGKDAKGKGKGGPSWNGGGNPMQAQMQMMYEFLGSMLGKSGGGGKSCGKAGGKGPMGKSEGSMAGGKGKQASWEGGANSWNGAWSEGW